MPYYYADFNDILINDSPIKAGRNKYEIECRKTTFIYKNYLDNLICNSEDDKLLLNDIFKSKRESRMGNEHSEDAVSWNVFRSLEKTKNIEKVLNALLNIKLEDSKIVYWSYDQNKKGIYELLINAREAVGEQKTSGTEPDIIVEDDKYVISIEAKYVTSNNNNSESCIEKLDKYKIYEKKRKLFKIELI